MQEEIIAEKKSKKPKRSRDEIVEIIVVILLGVTALLTAWASWIGSLHGGNQATNYTRSGNLNAEGNAMYNEASQSLMQDMMLWNSITEIRIELNFAEKKNDTTRVEELTWKLENLVADNVSDTFKEAIDWADAQEEYASPFEKDGYTESYYADAQAKIDEASAVLEQGKKDNANGDTFGLVTVIYSVVLFLLGICGSFKSQKNREVLVCVSAVGFLIATIFMFTIPLPTGFNLFSFFGA